MLDRVFRGEGRKRGGRQKEQAPPAEGLSDLARHCSTTERRAEAAEQELTKIKLLEFLQTKVGETFHGVITGVQAFGLFVEIPELLIDGLVHISNLADDQYAFDRRRWALVGRRKNRVLRVGTPLEVRIVRVDIPRRQLDLEPVEAKKGERAGREKSESSPKRGRAESKAKKPRRRGKRRSKR
jgi:ribonuclease R